jgi:hypothetical protein
VVIAPESTTLGGWALANILARYPGEFTTFRPANDGDDLGLMKCLGVMPRFFKESDADYRDPVVEEFIVSRGEDLSYYCDYGVVPKDYQIAINSMSKYDRPEDPLSDEVRRLYWKCGFWLDQAFGPFVFGCTVKSFDSAFSNLRFDTSPGFPWTQRFKDKVSFVMNPEMMEFHDRYWNALFTDDPIISLCSVILKEEIKSAEKLAELRARVIVAMDINHILSGIRFSHDYNERLKRTVGQHWITLGINIYEGGFHRLNERMMRFGENASIELDGKEFDCSYTWTVWFVILCHRFRMMHPFYRTPLIFRAMFNLHVMLAFSPIVCPRGRVFNRRRGGPSGHDSTTEDNCLKSFLDLSVTWCLIMSPEYHSYHIMTQYVEACINGDDVNESVDEFVRRYYNPVSIKLVSPRIDMVYHFGSDEFRTHSQCTFLGHTFQLTAIPGVGAEMYLPVIECRKMRTSMLIYNKHSTLEMTVVRACALRAETFPCVSCRRWFAELIDFLRVKTAHIDTESMRTAWSGYHSDYFLWEFYSGMDLAYGHGMGLTPQSEVRANKFPSAPVCPDFFSNSFDTMTISQSPSESFQESLGSLIEQTSRTDSVRERLDSAWLASAGADLPPSLSSRVLQVIRQSLNAREDGSPDLSSPGEAALRGLQSFIPVTKRSDYIQTLNTIFQALWGGNDRNFADELARAEGYVDALEAMQAGSDFMKHADPLMSAEHSDWRHIILGKNGFPTRAAERFEWSNDPRDYDDGDDDNTNDNEDLPNLSPDQPPFNLQSPGYEYYPQAGNKKKKKKKIKKEEKAIAKAVVASEPKKKKKKKKKASKGGLEIIPAPSSLGVIERPLTRGRSIYHDTSRTEILASVIGTSATDFTITNTKVFTWSANLATFPMMASQAANFTKWRLSNVTVKYSPAVSSNTNGTILIWFDPDPASPLRPTSVYPNGSWERTRVMPMRYRMQPTSWVNASMRLPNTPWKYTNFANASTEDLHEVCAGFLCYNAWGQGGTPALGTLEVTYDIEFDGPRLTNSFLPYLMHISGQSNTTVTGAFRQTATSSGIGFFGTLLTYGLNTTRYLTAPGVAYLAQYPPDYVSTVTSLNSIGDVLTVVTPGTYRVVVLATCATSTWSGSTTVTISGGTLLFPATSAGAFNHYFNIDATSTNFSFMVQFTAPNTCSQWSPCFVTVVGLTSTTATNVSFSATVQTMAPVTSGLADAEPTVKNDSISQIVRSEVARILGERAVSSYRVVEPDTPVLVDPAPSRT